MVFLLIVGACLAALFWKFWPRATRPGMVYQMKPRSCASVVDPLFLCFALLLVSCFVLLLVLLKARLLHVDFRPLACLLHHPDTLLSLQRGRPVQVDASRRGAFRRATTMWWLARDRRVVLSLRGWRRTRLMVKAPRSWSWKRVLICAMNHRRELRADGLKSGAVRESTSTTSLIGALRRI